MSPSRPGVQAAPMSNLNNEAVSVKPYIVLRLRCPTPAKAPKKIATRIRPARNDQPRCRARLLPRPSITHRASDRRTQVTASGGSPNRDNDLAANVAARHSRKRIPGIRQRE
jgi:hypothetical protein